MKTSLGLVSFGFGVLSSMGTFVQAACDDSTFDPNVDYFPDKATTDGLAGFTITYNNSYKVITNNMYESSVYVLYCTADPPAGVSNFSQFYKVPVTTTTALDPISISFLNLLGPNATSTLKFVGNTQNLTDPCLQSMAESQTIQNLNVNYSSPTPYDVAFMSNGFNGGFDYIARMIPVQLGTLSPLRKAEWIKFYSLFYNLEGTANSIFDNINTTYQCIRDSISDVTPRQKLAIVAYDPDNNRYTVKGDQYWSTIVRDAGAQSILNTTHFTSAQDIQANISNSFAIIDSTTPLSSSNSTFMTWLQIFGYQSLSNSDRPGFLNGLRVFRADKLVNPNGVFSSMGDVITRPDIFLQDLIHLQYPTFNTSYFSTWLENFSRQDPTTILKSDASACNSTRVPIFSQCPKSKFVADTSGGENVDNPGQDSPSSSDSSGSNKLSKGAVAGVSLGTIIAFGLIVGLIAFGFKRWRENQVRKRRAGTGIDLNGMGMRGSESMETGTRGQWVQFE